MIDSNHDIQIIKTENSRIAQVDFSQLSFGEIFSDHMYQVEYRDHEWQQPEIHPFGDITISPSTSILHYGQAVFEGLKAFRYKDGKINIFRARDHFNRFNRSCKRVSIPEISEELFIDGLYALVDLDRDWVPKEKYKSLYIRPFVFATDKFLGVRASRTYKFMILTGPVGNYYKNGLKPVSLTTMPDFVRAVKGGVGNAKVPGNYAASIYPAELAKEQGYTQILWLDACEKKFIEEVGTMNIFFMIDDVLITPALSGSILEGITRKTVLEVAIGMGYTTEERAISIDEVISASEKGTLQEAFGTGTAAVISPVGFIHHEEKEIVINNREIGPVVKKIYNHITGLHHGDVADTNNWCHVF
ncbi:MAG TPA: branched-chain amino acid aminotransferase [Balneolales bacterium]|nr:branched-chain amino acid aminotransferase [Balneolales bacterium]